MQVNINQAKDMIIRAIRAGLVPLIEGSPACGKSAIVHQIADEYGLKLIDLRLSQAEPTDLLGFPSICPQTGRGTYAPMDSFPIETDQVPEGYNGWLLFLDEFRSAPRAVQAASYKVVLDKQIGKYKLHPKVAIVCAGNLDTDGAIVEELSTALQSRLIHMEMVVDPNIWVDWATSQGIDHRITSFIKFKPDNLYTFKSDHTDKTYASPRTWEFANRILQQYDGKVDQTILPILAGTISEGVAREFIVFCRIYSDLPTLEQIIANPTGITVPDEPSILYALTGAISANASEKTLDSLMKFVNRLPIEFQVVTLREVVRRKKQLLSHASVQQWLTKNATELF